MKLITAIIKPFKLDDLRQTVAHIGVRGLTVTEVLGLGRELGHVERYRGARHVVDLQANRVAETSLPIAIVAE